MKAAGHALTGVSKGWRSENTRESLTYSACNIEEKTAMIPFDMSDRSVEMRAHIYLHAALSKDKQLGSTPFHVSKRDTVAHAFEDVRVNAIGKEMGIKMDNGHMWVPPPSPFSDDWSIASSYVACASVGLIPKTKELLLPVDKMRGVLKLVKKVAAGKMTPWNAADALLAMFGEGDEHAPTPDPDGDPSPFSTDGIPDLERLLDNIREDFRKADEEKAAEKAAASGGKPRSPSSQTKALAQEFNLSIKKHYTQASFTKAEAKREADIRKKEKDIFHKKPRSHDEGGDGQWGVMSITQVVMNKHVARKIPGMRPSETGSILKYPHRWVIDRCVLAEKRRRKGGTILIDMSGSMTGQTAPAIVGAIIKDLPALKVAGYASEDGTEGKLVIFADNGSCATSIPRIGGGNVIDGPALRWLARQPSPRIWVSDGCVTGVLDRCYPRLSKEAKAICASSRIERVPDLRKAIKRLQGKKLPGPGVIVDRP